MQEQSTSETNIWLRILPGAIVLSFIELACGYWYRWGYREYRATGIIFGLIGFGLLIFGSRFEKSRYLILKIMADFGGSLALSALITNLFSSGAVLLDLLGIDFLYSVSIFLMLTIVSALYLVYLFRAHATRGRGGHDAP